MKLIVSGASGYVGSEVVRQALSHGQVSSVIALARKHNLEEGADNPKLKNVVIKDYTEYPDDVKKELASADACIWTVAITPGRAKLYAFEEVKRVCQTTTLAAMQAIHDAGTNKPFRFVYMSGAAVERDPTKSSLLVGEYGKLRGETEAMVVDFAAKHGFEATAARAGPITQDKTMLGSVWGTLLRSSRVIPSLSVEQVAAGMLHQVINGVEKDPLTNADLLRIGQAALQEQKPER